MSDRLRSALSVTLELTGTRLSDEAALAFLRRLEREPERDILEALAQCVDECRYRLTVADVLSRARERRRARRRVDELRQGRSAALEARGRSGGALVHMGEHLRTLRRKGMIPGAPDRTGADHAADSPDGHPDRRVGRTVARGE